MKVYIQARFAYKECYEKNLEWGFKEIGMEVSRIPNPTADITIVVKWLQNPNLLFGKSVLIFPDSIKNRWDYFSKIEKYFDYIFCCHLHDSMEYGCYYLPFAHNPSIHRYIPCKKDIDVIHIGTMHEGFKEPLAELPIKIYGNEWHKVGDKYLNLEVRNRVRRKICYAMGDKLKELGREVADNDLFQKVLEELAEKGEFDEFNLIRRL